MPLTLLMGNSGSGKTTFINDIHRHHQCLYIRQYHMVRPNIKVCKIPQFNPSALPYWGIYKNERKSHNLPIGGSMGGEFVPGLSGGQRKILLFELIYQRIRLTSGLLICLDEPFAGVTEDFIPYIEDRLLELGKRHNIVVASNDHLDKLKEMADNTVVISALDRTSVRVNGEKNVVRGELIVALSKGDQFEGQTLRSLRADIKFFYDTEVYYNWELLGFVSLALSLFFVFLPSFWNSSMEKDELVLIAAENIFFLAFTPYLLNLTEWRVLVDEEAEALIHGSIRVNRIMKTVFMTFLLVFDVLLQYTAVVLTLQGRYASTYYLWAFLVDAWCQSWTYVLLAIYTNLSMQFIQTLCTVPYLFTMLFSTTFSPGSGVVVWKELRYLFPRFYLWCEVPTVKDLMEGCPPEDLNVVYLTVTGFLGTFIFIVVKVVLWTWEKARRAKSDADDEAMVESNDDLKSLQRSLSIDSGGSDP